MLDNFLKRYVQKKTQESLGEIDKFLSKIDNAEVKQGFNNEEKLISATIKFIDLLFENDSYEEFVKRYKQITEPDVTVTDDQLPF